MSGMRNDQLGHFPGTRGHHHHLLQGMWRRDSPGLRQDYDGHGVEEANPENDVLTTLSGDSE